MTNRYAVQTLVRLSVTFYLIGNPNEPADPSNVALTITFPNGSFETISSNIAHDGLGEFHYDFIGESPGAYTYRWQGSGSPNNIIAANIPVEIVYV